MTMQPKFSDWLARKPKGPAPKRPLPRVTPKRAKQNREYSVRRKAYLADNPYCEALVLAPGCACKVKACDVHHVNGRLGGNYLNEDTWLPVCRPCHNWIHGHPKEARHLGLLM